MPWRSSSPSSRKKSGRLISSNNGEGRAMTNIIDGRHKRGHLAEYCRQLVLAQLDTATIRMRWQTWKVAMAAFGLIFLIGLLVSLWRSIFIEESGDGFKYLSLVAMIVGSSGLILVSFASIKDEREEISKDGRS